MKAMHEAAPVPRRRNPAAPGWNETFPPYDVCALAGRTTKKSAACWLAPGVRAGQGGRSICGCIINGWPVAPRLRRRRASGRTDPAQSIKPYLTLFSNFSRSSLPRFTTLARPSLGLVLPETIRSISASSISRICGR